MLTDAIVKACDSASGDAVSFQNNMTRPLVREFGADMSDGANKAIEELEELNEMLFLARGAKGMVGWFQSMCMYFAAIIEG